MSYYGKVLRSRRQSEYQDELTVRQSAFVAKFALCIFFLKRNEGILQKDLLENNIIRFPIIMVCAM